MSAAAVYIVRATANAARDACTVWVGRGTAAGATVWRWEVLRVLWLAMGTAATAGWVAEHFQRAYPDAAAEVGPIALTEAVRQALHQADAYFPACA